MREFTVAITGFGGVGSRLAAELLARAHRYRELFATDVRLVGVCGSTAGIARAEGLGSADLASREGWIDGLTGERFIAEAPFDVLVEAGPSEYETGGPGLAYVREAIARGSDVIAISKSALALRGASLLAAARATGSRVFASGASAAGLPVVDFLSHGLAGAEVTRVEAVLTGTAAFVLDAVMRSGQTVDEAVAEAVRRGTAEPDPSFDLDGWDTAAKLVVIAGMAFGEWIDLASVPRASVRAVTHEDVLRWRAAGEKPALVGVLERGPDRSGGSGSPGGSGDAAITARVEIRAYPAGHSYASATGSTKALFVESRPFGSYALIGGASSPDATVAAALKDLEHLLAAR